MTGPLDFTGHCGGEYCFNHPLSLAVMQMDTSVEFFIFFSALHCDSKWTILKTKHLQTLANSPVPLCSFARVNDVNLKISHSLLRLVWNCQETTNK